MTQTCEAFAVWKEKIPTPTKFIDTLKTLKTPFFDSVKYF